MKRFSPLHTGLPVAVFPYTFTGTAKRIRRAFAVFIFMGFLLACLNRAGAQAISDSAQATYTKTITLRADKIVATLGINDAPKYENVKQIVTNQYRNLNTIYDNRDLQKKEAKAKNATNKQALDTALKLIETDVTMQLDNLHAEYLSLLNSNLNAGQVDKVKDGMTYSVVNVTYKGYQDMIPTLTEPQKAQILAWLIEAREHAIDAESSDKKHAWFGKYKGRINNYLSAQGYDAQKERVEWEKRIKAAEAAKQKG
ncbi:MAG: DUF3826 domain-containing protein [Chitinophagaceae bacterium]